MFDTLQTFDTTWMFGGFLFVAGLCIGSFLNVCIYRLPAGLSLVRPGSHCTSCQTPIAWYDNIPVASYLILRGRCRKCGASFSARYMAVELATGLLWFGCWLAYFKLGWRLGADHLGVYLVHMTLVSALLVSAVIDYERKEIYTSVTNLALAVGVAGSVLWLEVQKIGAYDGLLPDFGTGWNRLDAAVLSLVGAAVGAGLINLSRTLGTMVFRREAMGIGDVYLMAAIGAVLGWEAAVLVFLIAPFLGLPYGIGQLIWSKPVPAEAKPGGAEASAPPLKVNYGSLLATVVGFALMLASAAAARPAWNTNARVLLLAGLLAMGSSFLFIWREEREMLSEPQEPTPAPETASSHEVPYGPFLGLAACAVMVLQDRLVEWFRPGLQEMVRSLLG